MQNKSNKKSSYFQKKGGKCRITFIFLKKIKEQVHVQGKGMVNKNIIILFSTSFVKCQ